jgi:hypothetical protein
MIWEVVSRKKKKQTLFGHDCNTQTTPHISSRKRISTSGLKIINRSLWVQFPCLQIDMGSTREKSSHSKSLPVRTSELIHMTGSKTYSPETSNLCRFLVSGISGKNSAMGFLSDKSLSTSYTSRNTHGQDGSGHQC